MQTELYYIIGGVAFIAIIEIVILVLIAMLFAKVRFLRLQSQEVKNRIDNLRNPEFKREFRKTFDGKPRERKPWPPVKPGEGWTPNSGRPKTFQERYKK